MKRCAILIGIDITKGMPDLGAAVKNANQMAAWAVQQNFDIRVFTDEKAPVRVQEGSVTQTVSLD